MGGVEGMRERGECSRQEREIGLRWGGEGAMCMCVCGRRRGGRLQEMTKNRENTGRERDRRHGQTEEARVIFSGGTLTSHLSCLTEKKKERSRVKEDGGDFFSPILSDKT